MKNKNLVCFRNYWYNHFKKPDIYICQGGQYNYTTSHQYGYVFNADLLAGYINSSGAQQALEI